ncbi:MAG: thiamine pyrophosphate-binding protein [Pseudomonadota bacterium]
MANSHRKAELTHGMRSGGHILADQLQILGVDKVFCVPGESFLDLLDGLYDHAESMQTIVCRHEGGASNMADAYAKMTGKPGICAVTRGPGATNAANGVHTAFQDSTPMILLIGQVSRKMEEREAFQEMDYRRVFGQMAKWVAQIEDTSRIPEYISRAWKIAQSGRPGPVVLALPEDVLSEKAEAQDLRPAIIANPSPAPKAIEQFEAMLKNAKRPIMMVGGPGWSAQCCAKAMDIAERMSLPVVTSFRCQDYVDNDHPNYVGVVGIATSPKLFKRIAQDVDLLIVVGSRLGEMTTNGYSLIDIPNPQMTLVHVHAGADEIGHVYNPDLGIVASASNFFDALSAIETMKPDEDRMGWITDQRRDYVAFRVPTRAPGGVNMAQIITHITDTMPKETVLTNGAGNYTAWAHRFHKHCAYRTQVAPTSGSMGYAVPAAIAAKLAAPDQPVICLAGDGCFMMTSQELATAKQYDLNIIFLIVNNAMLGTIRMHQERNYPKRPIATQLANPDFVAYAASFGIAGERVERTEDFAAALNRANSVAGSYLIELIVDPQALTPSQTLDEVTAQGQKSSAK